MHGRRASRPCDSMTAVGHQLRLHRSRSSNHRIRRRSGRNSLIRKGFPIRIECMFAPVRDWQPPASAWAELWEQDDEIVEFEPSFDDVPGAASAALVENVDPAALSDELLIDAMAGWGRLASWAQARQSAVIAEFASRRPPEWADDARFVPEEIACALSLTVRGAGNRLALAQRLDEALPETRDAWEAGELDWPRVNLIAERTTTLTTEQARDVEREILPKVVNKTTGQLRRIVDRAVISADPEAAAARHEVARQQRDVTVRPIEDGMALLTATLDVEEAAAAERALNELVTKTGTGRADALMSLLTGDAEPALSGRPLIQVVVGASTLLGIDDQPAEIPGFGVIPADAARRIATDATWQRILTDPTSGAILDVGRKYRPPKALADYVRTRDRVCVFPPCRKAADKCDLDHRHPYSQGGVTSADNLQPMCPKHHELKHDHGWTVTRERNTTVWTSPTGHAYANYSEDFAVP
jgi:uncharacterized protein DUF222/HNH endonuclease